MNDLNEQIDDLEFRLLDLEFEDLKKWHAVQSILITEKPKTKDSGFQMRSIRMPDGTTRHRIRTVSGGWQDLPADTKLWPKRAREIHEAFAKIDRARTHGGRLVSNSASPEESNE